MPRLARVDVGGEAYHVINRANGRMQIFNEKEDYKLFEKLLLDAKELIDMRILAYSIMPNHWHLLLYPRHNGDLGRFMHRLTNAHTRQVHTRTKTIGSGHLYQGRYKSFLIDTDTYLSTVIKYIERNPVRAHLARRCENWQWGSAWRRTQGSEKDLKLIDTTSFPLSKQYTEWVNAPDDEEAITAIRHSVNKGVPYGRERWVDRMVKRHGLETTLRSAGRPRKI